MSLLCHFQSFLFQVGLAGSQRHGFDGQRDSGNEWLQSRSRNCRALRRTIFVVNKCSEQQIFLKNWVVFVVFCQAWKLLSKLKLPGQCCGQWSAHRWRLQYSQAFSMATMHQLELQTTRFLMFGYQLDDDPKPLLGTCSWTSPFPSILM